MLRVAKVVGLKPGHIERYIELHQGPRPGVLAALKRHHVRNYSIFHHDGILFSYFEYTGNDYEADMAAVRSDPESRRWTAQFADSFRPIGTPAPGEPRTLLDEIFHLD